MNYLLPSLPPIRHFALFLNREIHTQTHTLFFPKMRSRFLNVDYFTHASSSSSNPLKFPPLSVPSFDSNFCNTDDEDALSFDLTLNISLEIDRFPIEDALSRFFHDVLPHNLTVPDDRNASFSIGSDSKEIRLVEEREAELVGEEDKEIGTLMPRKKDANKEEDQGSLQVIQFETPELDFFLVEPFLHAKQNGDILFQVPGIDVPLEKDNNDLRDSIPYPQTVSDAVYSVRDIASDYNVEEKSSYFVEEDTYLKTFPFSFRYPCFEVNEINLELCTSSFMEDLHLLFENTGCQQLTQTDNLVVNGKEILGSTDIDILECFSQNGPSKQCLDSEPTCTHLMLEVDFLCIRKTNHFKVDSASDLETSDGFVLVTSPVRFQEVHILDIDFYRSFELFAAGSETAKEPETCNQMFGEDISSLYESIVSHELALVDDTFKVLPIPFLSDGVEICLLSAIVEELLAYLNPRPTSASDVIYLDWHLLQEDKCNHDICSTYWNMLEEVDTYSTGIELKSVNDELVVIDSDFCFDASDDSSNIESKEILTGLHMDVCPEQFFNDEDQNHEIAKPITKREAEMASSLLNSTSQFSDLDFFLNPRKVTSKMNNEAAVNKSHTTDLKFPVGSSSSLTDVCASTEVQVQKYGTEVHLIKLSSRILDLIDMLQKVYMRILENDINLKRGFSLPGLDNLKLLSFPKQMLMDWIKNSSATDTSLSNENEALMPFVALYAIKQMAHYLCFYGIHTTHLYVRNLCRNHKYLRDRLSLLESVMEDAHMKIDSDISQSHPSLSEIQHIIRMNYPGIDSKVLIVADQDLFYPLKRLLTSMEISFDVLQNGCTYPNQEAARDSTKFIYAAIQCSDCLLISHEHVSASFPFEKFNLVVDYGGSCACSRISSISSKLVSFPQIHFLNVALEDCSAAKLLSEGVDVSQNNDIIKELICQSVPTLDKDVKDQEVEELPNVVPTEKKCVPLEIFEPAIIESHTVPTSVSSMPLAVRSKQIQTKNPSYPDTVIIMNTQTCDKEMLISRRSTYQKILAMEKGGSQVVEREVNLPVDLIFTAAMCLVWYDCINIGKKATTTDEAFSCVPLWVENIATNILTSLSFAFSNCILVFEGDNRFLSAVMESSDGLYAAAASLGVDLQLFCSYSSEITDEIILSCIDYATKLNRGLYPKMLELETLAESFLTRFPSINPLSAHAILSSGGMLIEFLEWSHARRVQAIRKYHVQSESVALFSALCEYGEREESKSGMTDCSSGSSAQASISSFSELEFRKRQKCSMDSHSTDVSMNDCFIFEPSRQSTYSSRKPPKASQAYETRIFSKKNDAIDESKMSNLFVDDQMLCREQCFNTSVMKGQKWHDINRAKNVYDDFMGEVIDLSSLDEDLCIQNTKNFSARGLDIGRDITFQNSSGARRLSLDTSEYPAFPKSAEIKTYSEIWNTLKNRNKKLKEDICDHRNMEIDMDLTPPKTCEGLLENSMMQKSKSNVHGLLSRQNMMRPYGVTSLSNAINSSELQQGSPWTTEFLNKIKEKNEMHRQALLGNTHFGYSDEVGKFAKRSPSILNSYRYQGGSSLRKTMKKKLQKAAIPPSSSSKNDKASNFLLQKISTPIDKRARQTLSFSRNGPEKQSKLVWIDGSSPGPRKRYRKDE